MLDFKIKKIFFVLRITLELVIPILLFLHGLDWIIQNKTGVSSVNGDICLYLIKISPIPFLLLSINNYGIKPFLLKSTFCINLLFLFLFLFGLLNPFFSKFEISFFYYLSDFFGLLILLLSINIFTYALLKKHISLSFLFSTYFKSLFSICIVIFLYSILSFGQKVSIPPEIHFHISIFMGMIFFRFDGFRIGKVKLFFIIAAIVLSQMRIYLIILFLSGILFLFFYLFIQKKWKLFGKNLPLILLVISMIVLFAGDTILERINSVNTIQDSSIYDDEFFEDASAQQRLIEATSIFKKIENSSTYYLVFGQGFGAQYDLVSIDGSKIKHHSHVAYISILFRNGILGLCILIVPLIQLIKNLFTKNLLQYFISTALLLTYFAFLTDQYIYWGFTFAIAISMFNFVRSNTSKLKLDYKIS